MNQFIEWVSWKKALFFTVLLAIVYILINYSNMGVAGLLQVTNGANILDFEFGYTTSMAYDLLTALGNDGRSFYITKILPLDFPFPFTYMLCYFGWIALMGKYAIPKSALKLLLTIPVLAMVFDWTENIGIIAMIRNYPLLPTWAVMTGSIAGMLKTVLTICSWAVMILLLAIIILRKAMRK